MISLASSDSNSVDEFIDFTVGKNLAGVVPIDLMDHQNDDDGGRSGGDEISSPPTQELDSTSERRRSPTRATTATATGFLGQPLVIKSSFPTYRELQSMPELFRSSVQKQAIEHIKKLFLPRLLLRAAKKRKRKLQQQATSDEAQLQHHHQHQHLSSSSSTGASRSNAASPASLITSRSLTKDVLKAIPLFSSWNAATLESSLIPNARLRRYEPGEVIDYAGDPSTRQHLRIVMSGFVACSDICLPVDSDWKKLVMEHADRRDEDPSYGKRMLQVKRRKLARASTKTAVATSTAAMASTGLSIPGSSATANAASAGPSANSSNNTTNNNESSCKARNAVLPLPHDEENIQANDESTVKNIGDGNDAHSSIVNSSKTTILDGPLLLDGSIAHKISLSSSSFPGSGGAATTTIATELPHAKSHHPQPHRHVSSPNSSSSFSSPSSSASSLPPSAPCPFAVNELSFLLDLPLLRNVVCLPHLQQPHHNQKIAVFSIESSVIKACFEQQTPQLRELIIRDVYDNVRKKLVQYHRYPINEKILRFLLRGIVRQPVHPPNLMQQMMQLVHVRVTTTSAGSDAGAQISGSAATTTDPNDDDSLVITSSHASALPHRTIAVVLGTAGVQVRKDYNSTEELDDEATRLKRPAPVILSTLTSGSLIGVERLYHDHEALRGKKIVAATTSNLYLVKVLGKLQSKDSSISSNNVSAITALRQQQPQQLQQEIDAPLSSEAPSTRTAAAEWIPLLDDAEELFHAATASLEDHGTNIIANKDNTKNGKNSSPMRLSSSFSSTASYSSLSSPLPSSSAVTTINFNKFREELHLQGSTSDYGPGATITTASEVADRAIVFKTGVSILSSTRRRLERDEAIGFLGCLVAHRWAGHVVAVTEVQTLEFSRDAVRKLAAKFTDRKTGLNLLDVLTAAAKCLLFPAVVYHNQINLCICAGSIVLRVKNPLLHTPNQESRIEQPVVERTCISSAGPDQNTHSCRSSPNQLLHERLLERYKSRSLDSLSHKKYDLLKIIGPIIHRQQEKERRRQDDAARIRHAAAIRKYGVAHDQTSSFATVTSDSSAEITPSSVVTLETIIRAMYYKKQKERHRRKAEEMLRRNQRESMGRRRLGSNANPIGGFHEKDRQHHTALNKSSCSDDSASSSHLRRSISRQLLQFHEDDFYEELIEDFLDPNTIDRHLMKFLLSNGLTKKHLPDLRELVCGRDDSDEDEGKDEDDVEDDEKNPHEQQQQQQQQQYGRALTSSACGRDGGSVSPILVVASPGRIRPRANKAAPRPSSVAESSTHDGVAALDSTNQPAVAPVSVVSTNRSLISSSSSQVTTVSVSVQTALSHLSVVSKLKDFRRLHRRKNEGELFLTDPHANTADSIDV